MKKGWVIGAVVVIILWWIFRPSVQNPQPAHMRTDSNTLDAVQAVETELKQSDAKAVKKPSPAP